MQVGVGVVFQPHMNSLLISLLHILAELCVFLNLNVREQNRESVTGRLLCLCSSLRIEHERVGQARSNKKAPSIFMFGIMQEVTRKSDYSFLFSFPLPFMGAKHFITFCKLRKDILNFPSDFAFSVRKNLLSSSCQNFRNTR